MRYTRLIAVLAIVFSSFFCEAQNKKIASDFGIGFNIRTSLHTLLDYDAGITLGAGYRWSRNFSAALEPTFIFYNALITDREEKIYPTGLKIRADVKYHFNKRRNRSPDFFISPELHYKYVTTNKTALFGMNMQNGQYSFFQNAVYKEVKKEIGGLFKIGMIVSVANNDRWFMELYSGFGGKALKFRETDLPAGGAFINPPNYALIGTGDKRTSDTRPMLPAGLKVFFLLK